MALRLICAIPNPGCPGTPRGLFFRNTPDGERLAAEFAKRKTAQAGAYLKRQTVSATTPAHWRRSARRSKTTGRAGKGAGDGAHCQPRAYNGQKSRWYQAAMRQKAGQIIVAGMTKEVIFEAVDGPINDRIDDAYRAKYHCSPYLSPMIGARTRSATVKVMPCNTGV